MDRTDERLPDITPILDAAAAMPESVRVAVREIGRCAAQDRARARRDPAMALARIVRDASRSRSPVAPTVLMDGLEKLDAAIRRCLASELGLELAPDESDINHCQAVLNGRAYEISHGQLLFLRTLLQADGATVRGADIARQHGAALAGTRLDRHHRALPGPIRVLVEAMPGRGGGYRMVLT